ncbi:hypothetical protein BD410DRAFT_57894 [Rickenella mellea]|uniref:Uncharacterized protein n=1 Tax=Rickenella mellea TaxID=50990 RepID=A0A4Y7QCY1_9AGAM|nr:hypothetical protein BD410DRAFT_57894 [Rickenella mellea]
MLFNAKSLEPNGQDVQDSVSVASSVSISADDECNDEFAEEISSNVHWQQGRTRNRAKMYGRLLRLHVSHIHAVRDLMRFCVASKLAPKFKFHFIKAPLISGVKSMLSWRETFKNALRPLYDTDSPDRLDQDVEHAVNAFTSAIKECKSERIGYRMHALKKSLESNDDLFTMSSPPGKFQFKGGLHGEAVLASIMSSPGLTGLGNHAEAVIKCMDDNVIGVSKLCCATCWEILNTLRGNDREIFAVRGCHKAFGDVELPTWLPKDAILKIMGALRYHLRNTLNSMIKAENAKSSRSPECSWEDELNQIHDDNLDIDFDLDDVFF